MTVEQPNSDDAAFAKDLAVVEAARAGGAMIHDMPVEATAVLAARYGMFTVTEPRHPDSFPSFCRRMQTARALGRLASNTHDAMQNVPGYEDAGPQLGSQLASAFGAITAVRAEGIRVDSGVGSKKVIADGLFFSVPTEQAARLVAAPLQALLRTSELDRVYPIYMPRSEDGAYTVEVRGGISEFMVRVLGSAFSALIAQEDRTGGVVLPSNKRSLEFWLKTGETFPPQVLDRLAGVDRDYQNLVPTLEATYPGRPELRPAISPHALGTEPAAAFEATRKLFNGLIHALRGGSHVNQEQDPNKKARLLIEQGVELRRDPVPPSADLQGPKNPRTLSPLERLSATGKKTAENIRSRPIHAGLRLLIAAATAGVENLAEIALYVPSVTKTGRQFAKDYNEWRRQKQAAIEAGAKIDRAIVARKG